MKYSPEKIFAGLIPALDINFVNPQSWDNGGEMDKRSITIALHETIASWYVSLRNLAVVALMLVLVYVGIRIVISSTASDKAKYKQMLMDWLVALCILFCLHYIMTFTTTIVNEVTRAISGSASSGGNNVAIQVGQTDENGNLVGEPECEFNTDLMGLIRFKMQAPNVTGKILYLILYLAMVIYTCMFTFYYLKRVLTIAFLTLISPLVAITYPIDKMRDGKAQAFDMWLKEYTFNALLQPFHLIIYSIFVGSAIDLAAKNPLYAIVALAFITPAEKILRKFFGFEKASTASALGAVASAAGGAALMNQMRSLMAPKKGGGGAGGSKGIRNKNNPEGSAPGLEVFGNGSGGNSGNNDESANGENDEGPQESPQQRMLDAHDEGFGTDSYDPAEREAMAREAYQPSSNSMNYTDDELRQIYRDTGYTENEISSMVPSSNSSGIRSQDTSFQWSESDRRGMGQWLGDGIKNSRLGQGVQSKYKAITGSAREMARNSRIGKGIRHIPKPIRNSVRGAAYATGKVALSAGKAALKAAPGAMIGMAAGIAGDELSDIPKYTLAGAALSSTIGSSAVAQAGSFIRDSYREGSGTLYETEMRQRKENYVKDNEELYKQKFPDASKKELKEKLEQGAYYDSVGIEGKDTLKAVSMQERLKKQIQEQEKGLAEDEANRRAQAQTAAIMKEVKDYNAKDLVDEKKVESLKNNLSKRLEGQGLKGREKTDTVDMIVREMKRARGVGD